MTATKPLSEPIRQAVERSFAQEQQASVLEALQTCWQWDAERVSAGILVLACGDPVRLQELTERARRDARDILIQFDQPQHPLARDLLLERARGLGLCSVLFPREDPATVRSSSEREVKRFLADELITAFDLLQPWTRLHEDLGIDAAAGMQLLAKFGRRFGIDMSGFEPGRYFVRDDGPFVTLVKRVLRLRARAAEPITIGELADAVERRRW